MSWTDNSTNEDGFKIERKPASGGAFTQIATTGRDTTAYSDPLLNDATTHCYRVRAFNTNGDSAYSNETCATATDIDTDGDGLPDDAETYTYGTDPSLADTDGDGISDGVEISYWSDPLDSASTPVPAVTVIGNETAGLTRGPLFHIYGLDGRFRVGRLVLNPDFTDVSFKQNVRTGAGPERILVCGIEPVGSARGPAIQLYERDGALVFSIFVLSQDFTRMECHTLDKDSDGIDEILVLGQETTGASRGWAAQLFDQGGQLLCSVFVANPNITNVFIKTSR